jgi:hypothetical protein|tara:strand:+ start:1214 stop:1360 length:147 start_codon:yes stop_codon:yes gene_type:complete
MKNTVNSGDDEIFLSLKEKEKNINKVVNRYMRIRLKRRVRKLTGIKLG